jgi:hypothetical protein
MIFYKIAPFFQIARNLVWLVGARGVIMRSLVPRLRLVPSLTQPMRVMIICIYLLLFHSMWIFESSCFY